MPTRLYVCINVYFPQGTKFNLFAVNNSLIQDERTSVLYIFIRTFRVLII